MTNEGRYGNDRLRFSNVPTACPEMVGRGYLLPDKLLNAINFMVCMRFIFLVNLKEIDTSQTSFGFLMIFLADPYFFAKLMFTIIKFQIRFRDYYFSWQRDI